MQTAVIVDGFSSGKYYPAAFKKLGYRCVHVHSDPDFIALQDDLNASEYELLFICRDNPEEIASKLKELSPSIIIPGCESGVELADFLSEKLNLKTNGTKLSKARRNKFVMQETIKQAGLRSIKQIKTNDSEVAWQWLQENKIEGFVIKPLQSAGTDSFYYGHNQSDLNNAFAKIMSAKDLFGKQNHEVLIQEKIVGQEYAVNTVSYNGQHYISDWLKYKKIIQENSAIYDEAELMEFSVPEFNVIREYVFAVLNALGIKYGPAHTEVFLTKDGPVLVESGARLAGASTNPVLFERSVGHSQLGLSVLSYTNPEKFLVQIKEPYGKLKAHLKYVMLISSAEGKVQKLNRQLVTSLPSFFDLHFYTEVGKHLVKTRDLITSPGIIYLCHEDKDTVKKDYDFIREIERNRLIEFCA